MKFYCKEWLRCRIWGSREKRGFDAQLLFFGRIEVKVRIGLQVVYHFKEKGRKILFSGRDLINVYVVYVCCIESVALNVLH